jgi:hypothetical protein
MDKSKTGDEQTGLFLDQCGGHASPYHYHADLVCEYDLTTGTHSRATGAALDGHIIYGATPLQSRPFLMQHARNWPRVSSAVAHAPLRIAELARIPRYSRTKLLSLIRHFLSGGDLHRTHSVCCAASRPPRTQDSHC